MLHEANNHGAGFVRGHVREAKLDGKDISTVCFACHTEEGWADVFLRDDNGRIIRGPDGKPKSQRLYGKVEVSYVPPLPDKNEAK